MITAEQINFAYDGVTIATERLAASVDIETQRRARLEQFKSEAIAAGQIDGKNAEAREGQLEVDRCKTLLKLLEVTGGGRE